MKRTCFSIFLSFLAGFLPAQNSVLSTGDWYKLGIAEDGIYKIDLEVLQQLEISENLNPSNLNVYGNAVGVLPQLNSADRPNDLNPVDVMWVGNDDEIWTENEYFVFYAKGPDSKKWIENRWQFENNIYTDQAYYFIKISNDTPNRIETYNPSEHDVAIMNADVFMVAYSPEEINLLDYVGSGGSGRVWFGELMIPSVGLVRNFTFTTPNLIDSLTIDMDLIGFAENQTTFDILLNQEDLGSLQVNSSTVSTYSIKGRRTTKSFETLSSGEEQELTVDFVRTEGSIFGFVKQITLNYRRELAYNNTPLFFNNAGRVSSEYRIGINTTKDLSIWNLRDPRAAKQVSSPSQIGTFVSFSDTATQTFEYVAFDPTTIEERPVALGPIQNQNIRALSPADGLIVTAPEFINAANDLAELHRTRGNLAIEVVTTEEIYLEFSSGMQDVSAIRDAIRHYYQKSPDFRYVLLFGDCSFDYKDRLASNTNYVPIYQSIDSWDPVYSYSSDDYFGFMEEDEGEWIESTRGDHTMEVGVGRLPVKSVSEANSMVEKIRSYMDQSAVPGEWKNVMTYVADDGNAGYNDTRIHMEDAEDFSDLLRILQPQVEYKKLYIDAFNQTVSGNSESSEEARAALKEAIEGGTFMVNFIGHGSEQRWTEEDILDLELIREMNNSERLPLFATATCEFGRYDDPTLIAPRGESGAEKLVLKPDGGAIALITTTRPVFSFTNYPVNRALHFFLLRPLETGPEQGMLPRLGDLVRLVKNNSLAGPVNRNFALLGDPMLRLNYPPLKVEVTSINERPTQEDRQDTLKALQPIIISGQVTDHLGQVASNFNGTLQVRVYDQTTEKLTLGQRDEPFPYQVRENILFQGDVSVRDGSFDVSFIMPKNISYQFGQGAISFYGFSEDLAMDASGGYSEILIGGSDTNPELDTDAPIVEITMNNPNFSLGAPVTRSDTLIVMIQDQSGINITGLGLNRDITLSINDVTYTINGLYKANLDDFQSGTIKFPLADLSAGRYNATINLFDLHNNEATETVEFIITDQPTIPLTAINIFPNPARERFNLTFDHPRRGESLQIGLQLISMNGNLVAEYSWTRPSGRGFSENVEVTLSEKQIQNGVYFCRMQVVSALDGAIGETVSRVVIIN